MIRSIPLRGAAIAALVALTLSGCGGGSSSSPTTPPMVDATLSLSLSGTGTGTVTSSPAGINCGSACTASFTQGTAVTLTAAPSNVFNGWSGACAGTAPTCTVTLNQNQTVTASFVTSSTPTAKPPLIGLVTMGSENWLSTGGLPQNRLLEANAHPGVYVAAVIEVTWSQLEPQPGVFDDSVIDAALQNIATYNATYPSTPLVGKLRLFAGPNTPAWVMQQVGSVTLTDSAGNSAAFPDFWTAPYSALWTQLQNHLASVYDGNPLMGEVAITACSSIDAEPFITGFAQDTSALLAAGYTDAQMEQCLGNAAQDYAAWTITPLDYTFNALFLRTTPGLQGNSTAFTIQTMQNFRAALGVRGVVANHALGDPNNASLDAPIYAEFQALYSAAQSASPPTLAPLEFQTFSPAQVDWTTAVPSGISTYHPTEIEIWNTTATGQGGLAPVTLSELQQWKAQLASANP